MSVIIYHLLEDYLTVSPAISDLTDSHTYIEGGILLPYIHRRDTCNASDSVQVYIVYTSMVIFD